jgi:anti-anti-sigma regulatory factor
MTAPVYRPPSRVDGSNVEAFRRAVMHSATRYAHVVVDCSHVAQMGPSAMRVLELAARDAEVELVNPNQALRLMATAYGLRIVISKANLVSQLHA